MKLPVVIGIDRCGLVGEDGETHHGVFDITMLHAIPNLIMAQPKDVQEARALMKTAFQLCAALLHPLSSRQRAVYEGRRRAGAGGDMDTLGPQREARVCVISYGSDIDGTSPRSGQ